MHGTYHYNFLLSRSLPMQATIKVSPNENKDFYQSRHAKKENYKKFKIRISF